MAHAERSTTNTAGAVRREDPGIDQEELALLASAKRGDSAAFEKLILPQRRRILSLAQHMLRSREDAEDVVQIALLQAFTHLDGFQGQARFSSWLIRITMNAALMRLRVLRRRPESSLDQMMDDDNSPTHIEAVETRLNPEQAYLAQERQAILAEALSQMGSRNQRILYLRHIRELTPKETSEVLGISMSTMKVRLYRARLKLIESAHSILCRKAKPSVVKHGTKAIAQPRVPRLQASEAYD
jgi:RNA polymerase sigma-70 factor, ECF subfamily